MALPLPSAAGGGDDKHHEPQSSDALPGPSRMEQFQAAASLAIDENDEAATCRLIDDNEWLDWKSMQVKIWLISICIMGMDNAAAKLLRLGTKFTSQNFRIAISNRHRKVAELLLEYGYDITEPPCVLTYVFVACIVLGAIVLILSNRSCLGDEEWQDWLISKGADPNVYHPGFENDRALCALDYTAGFHTLADVQDMIKHGADVQRSDALMWVIRRKTCGDDQSLEMMRWLIDHGARVDKIFHDHLGEWAQYDVDCGTPYHEAIARDRPEAILQVLLDAGANPDALSKEGLTPIEWKERHYCTGRSVHKV